MTPLTVGQRLFCLGREGEVMQTSTIERITEHSVFVHPDIGTRPRRPRSLGKLQNTNNRRRGLVDQCDGGAWQHDL